MSATADQLQSVVARFRLAADDDELAPLRLLPAA